MTAERIHMTISIFFVNLVIYGFVPLFATLDVRPKHEAQYLEGIFRGMYYDYNAEWFQDVGVLVCKTMTFNIFMPPIEVLIYWLIRYAYRASD